MKAWFVQSNYISGVGMQYIASRIIDRSKPVHSGNIEHHGAYSSDRAQVEKTVKELNAAEVEKEVKRFGERRAEGKKV